MMSNNSKERSDSYFVSVLKQCLSMWTCLLVDEFQDTSKMQYELLCLLASHKRVTVVGDDDQVSFLSEIDSLSLAVQHSHVVHP